MAMNFKRATSASLIAVGVGVATLTAGVASAQPPGPCGPGVCQGPGGPGLPNGPGSPGRPSARFDAPPPPPAGLGWRGVDQARLDHRPFNYNGHWVTPIFNPDFNNWGFWLFGLWIPL